MVRFPWAKIWTLASLIACWCLTGGYVYLGGRILNRLELQTEKDAATDYCTKIDMLLTGLNHGQRKRFSSLLNTLIGAGMCRAPACKPQPLPTIAMKYTLQDSTCSAFWGDVEGAFVESIEAAFHKHLESIEARSPHLRHPLSVEVTACTDVGWQANSTRWLANGTRRLSSTSTSIELAARIRSDTKEAVDLKKKLDDLDKGGY